MTALAVALVDYDNVRTKDERTAGDVVMNLGEIIRVRLFSGEARRLSPERLATGVEGVGEVAGARYEAGAGIAGRALPAVA
jgi:ribosomal protein L2